MSTNYKAMRRQLFVDPKVQGALVGRAVLYWVVCIITIALMLLSWRIVTGPARPFYTHFDDMWFFYGPALIASFLLLPLVIVDIIRLSNRFAGPLLRLRRCMRELARGEYVERNALRAGLVERAEDWRWGSLHQRTHQADGPPLCDWPLPQPPDWTEYVNAPQTEAELEAIRRCVRRGRPYGDAIWTEQTAQQLGLQSTLRRRGRPRKQAS